MPKKTRKTTSKTASKVSQSLSIKYKEEAVLAWICNGEVLDGKKISRKELAKELGLTEYKITVLIDRVKDGFSKMFESKAMVKKQVFTIAGTLLQQLSENRARAVMHDDQLRKQIHQINEYLEKASELSEGEPIERNQKRQKVSTLMGHLRFLNSQRTESIRLLCQTSQALNNFLGLFSDNGKSQVPLDPTPDEDQPKFLDFKDAITIIEDTAGTILPKQNSQAQFSRTNPNAGFEELKHMKNKKQKGDLGTEQNYVSQS